MHKSTILTLVALASLSLGAQGAVITEITSRAAFNALVSGQTTETFSSFGVSPGNTTNEGNPLTTSVGTFSNNNVYFVSNGGLGAGDGSSFLTSNGFYGYASTLTLNPGYNAAGSDVFDTFAAPASTHPESAVVTETDGINLFAQTFNFTIPGATGSPSTTFEGFIATKGMTLVSITYNADNTGHNFGDGEYHAFDNFSVGNAVPEPSTYVLMMGGIGVLAFLARRRASHLV